jgi:hypothetical protein
MKAVRQQPVPPPLPTTTSILLAELREECERVAGLIRRLEDNPASERVRDEILGELSAAVLHLHTHTAGLDEFLCEEGE